MIFGIEVFYVVLGAILSHLPRILEIICRFLKRHWVRCKVDQALRKSLRQRAARGEDVPQSLKAAEAKILTGAKHLCGYRALPKNIKERYLTISKTLVLFAASYESVICRGEGCLRVFTHHDRYIAEKDSKAWDLLQAVLEEEDAWIVRQIFPENHGVDGGRQWLLELSTGADKKETLKELSKNELEGIVENLQKLKKKKQEQLANAKAWQG